MGKRAEQNKKRKRLAAGDADAQRQTTHARDGPPTPALSPDLEHDADLISRDDLDTTLLTLETLCEVPEELARKEVKDIKRAVYALQRVMADGMTLGTSNTQSKRFQLRLICAVCTLNYGPRYISILPHIDCPARLPLHRCPHPSV